MFIVMGVTLYTSRIVLRALGIEDYGIYNVVGGIVSFFAFMNGAMSRTTQRFVAFELGKGNHGDVVSVFSTCVTVHVLIAIAVFLLAETIGLFALYNLLIIPPERFNAAFWVYQFSIMSCLVMIISTPYNGAIVAHEKMMAFAYISVIDAILRLIVAYAITHDYSDRLIVYGALLLMVQIITRLYYNVYCYFFLPTLKYKYNRDYSRLKEVMSFSGWTLFDNFSIISCSQGVGIVLNMFFPPAINAARGIAGQVESAVKAFSMNFQTSTYPQITKSYSNGDKERMFDLLYASSKYSYFLLLIVSYPLFVEVEEVLNLWLGIIPAHCVDFIRVILLISLINVLADPLAIVVGAKGNIKKFQMNSGISFVSILPISYTVFVFYENPLIIFYVYLAISVLVLIYKLLYTSKETGMSINSYLNSVLFPVISVTLVLCFLMKLVVFNFGLDNIFELLLHICCYILLSITVICIIGLSHKERYAIMAFLHTKLHERKD